MKDWHLRMTITSFCNYECAYCSRTHPKVYLDKKEIIEILEAAFSTGIKRVHWTGGEPSCHPGFIDCVHIAKEIGYVEQIMSTNGSFANVDHLLASPIDRFNVSLDTLDENLFSKLTNRNNLHHVLDFITMAHKADKPIKINCVVMRDNINEIPMMIDRFSRLNTIGKKNIVLRLIQFYPSNPNQIDIEGQKYWAVQYVTYEEILEKIGKHKATQTDGDNPTFKYFELEDYPLKVGVLAMFSWNYICGGCMKMRVTPYGEASICLSDEKIFRLKGLSIEEKIETIRNAMKRRENINAKSRQHFNPHLGIFRFGVSDKKTTISELYNCLEQNR